MLSYKEIVLRLIFIEIIKVTILEFYDHYLYNQREDLCDQINDCRFNLYQLQKLQMVLSEWYQSHVLSKRG